jgi:hypothetical protein
LNRSERRALARDISKQMASGAVDLAAPPQRPATIFLGWLYRDPDARPYGAWVQSLLACAARSASLGFGLIPQACETGPQLDKARNMLLRSFLTTELDYLLFSDTDIVFTPDDVKLLLEADAPIAGALYFTAAADTEPWPVALEWGPDESEGTSKSLVPITLPEPPEDLFDGDHSDFADPNEKFRDWEREALAPRRVDALGAGLLLIRRDAALAVAERHARPFEYADGRSEDANFCLRAAELGFESLLVPQARVGHIKAVVL